MKPGTTSIGGPSDRFPATTLGLFSRIGTPGGAGALEELFKRYWKPVYGFIRAGGSRSNEDAKDLAQGFFLHALEGETLQHFDPGLGSFRGYLKTLLQRFLVNEHRAAGAQKRGGGKAPIPLDGMDVFLKESVVDPGGRTPEQVFDREWVGAVIDAAMERVRRRFTSEGRALQFQVYEELEMKGQPEPLSQAAVAARFGLREVDVRHQVFAVREALRAELREELFHTTSDPGELEREWNDLFGA